MLRRLCTRRRWPLFRKDLQLPVADRSFLTVSFRHCTNFLHSQIPRSVLRPDIAITIDGKVTLYPQGFKHQAWGSGDRAPRLLVLYCMELEGVSGSCPAALHPGKYFAVPVGSGAGCAHNGPVAVEGRKISKSSFWFLHAVRIRSELLRLRCGNQNTGSLFCPTTAVCHFWPVFRCACWRSSE